MIHPNGGCSNCLEETFAFIHQEYTSGAEKLSRVTENTYSPDGIKISVIKEFVYDPNYILLLEEKITNSDSRITRTMYKYPFHYNDEPYATMISAFINMLSPVVEQEQYMGNTWLQTVKTDYKEWHSDVFTPEYVKTRTNKQAGEEVRMTYHDYDSKGNPWYISKDNAEKVIYLWGYNHRYPIAEIKGVDFSAVTAHISQTALETIAAKAEPSASDFITINNLRALLPGAMVTTYTYKPLVGMKKMTDPRGIETIYDYDTFGRLNKVTHAGKAVKGYEYKYKN